ncbi:hypothetical protein [Thioflexithrix psekupsensis]|uniref:Uncharacterized protein n=1 Tax=Thioflexithrix psekupsensis TaxID=1570016 RepID=A0A251X800_9GAMM|nr:hypothetical protein [Thioflexithrix psekupsensis]OUD13857.1 hypothetical protein TPSD3_05780 [Thioflexithrix psekupsensis]
MSEARRNQYDRHHCLEQGQRAEDQFIALIQQRGWQVQRASEHADKHEHWDCVIEKPPRRFKVDVKAMKRIRRQDVTVQDQWLWIELHGVRPSDRGWLYAGQADLLAIEQQTHFLLLKRLDLIDFVDQFVDRQKQVATADQARYCVYSRPGRVDQLTLIEIKQLCRYLQENKSEENKPAYYLLEKMINP